MDSQRHEEEGEGTVKFVVPNTSRLEAAMLSKPVTVRNLPWRLLLAPQDVLSCSQDGRSKAVAIFVQCTPEATVSPNWSVSARVTTTLVNQVNPSKNYSKEFQHCFSARQSDWGYSTFMKWKNIVDPAKGFIKDDTIILQAHIVADVPTGIESPGSIALSNPSHLQEHSVLACPVCCDDYQTVGQKRPMSLKCGHTFCQECLQKNCSRGEGGEQIKCSLCNQQHTSLGGDSKPWFPNYSVMHIIGNVIPKSKHFCELHRHEKNYYCLDDQKLVCIYCAYHGEHSEHHCEHIDRARGRVKDSLCKAKLQATSRASELDRNLQLLKDEQECLKFQEETVSEMVEGFFGKVEAGIRRQKEGLLEELRTRTGEVNGELGMQVRELEGERSDLGRVLEEYTTWEDLPTRDAMERSASLQSHLKTLSNKCANIHPRKTAKITFEMPCSDILTSIGQLGKVLVTPSQSQTEGIGQASQTLPASNGSTPCTHLELGTYPPAKRRKENE